MSAPKGTGGPTGCALWACILLIAPLLCSFLATGLFLTVAVPALVLVQGQLDSPLAAAGATLLWLFAAALSVRETLILLRPQQDPAPPGYEQISGLFDTQWAERLQAAAGCLVEADSPLERQANASRNYGCLALVLLGFLGSVVCVASAAPGQPISVRMTVLGASILISLIGIVLWWRFVRALRRSQRLDHWLKLDFQCATAVWFERGAGRPALQGPALECRQLLLTDERSFCSLFLVDAQGNGPRLFMALKMGNSDFQTFAEVLAQRMGLPLVDQRSRP